MITTIDPKVTERPTDRCTECDRETNNYNTFLSPTNEQRTVCWVCLAREEKGFNAKRDFRRSTRRGVVPR